MVAVSACMCGTRGSGVLSSTGDVLEMSVVTGREGHPILSAGAAHGIAGILATTTNDFQEFLRSRLQIGHD